MEEETNNNILVDFGPGTTLKEPQEEIQEQPQPPAPLETKLTKLRTHKLNVRLEGEA